MVSSSKRAKNVLPPWGFRETFLGGKGEKQNVSVEVGMPGEKLFVLEMTFPQNA